MQGTASSTDRSLPRADPDLELIDPSIGEAFAGSVASAADVDTAVAGARAAFVAQHHLGNATGHDPPDRRTPSRNNADELVRLESQNTGKPIAVTYAEEIFHGGPGPVPSPVPRVLEGRATAEHERLHLLHPP